MRAMPLEQDLYLIDGFEWSDLCSDNWMPVIKKEKSTDDQILSDSQLRIINLTEIRFPNIQKAAIAPLVSTSLHLPFCGEDSDG